MIQTGHILEQIKLESDKNHDLHTRLEVEGKYLSTKIEDNYRASWYELS